MPFHRLYYHLVWATEKREPVITPEMEQELYAAICSKVKALGGYVFALNGHEDHVHLAGSIPPKVSVSDFVGQVKGSSSFHINHLPGDRPRLQWQREYGVMSFRRTDVERIVEYIERQKEHHGPGGTVSRTLETCSEEEDEQAGEVREERVEYGDAWG